MLPQRLSAATLLTRLQERYIDTLECGFKMAFRYNGALLNAGGLDSPVKLPANAA